MADSVLLLALYPLGLTVGGDDRKQLWYCLLTTGMMGFDALRRDVDTFNFLDITLPTLP